MTHLICSQGHYLYISLKDEILHKKGFREVCGEQVLTRECYVQELKVGEKNVKMAELPTLGDQNLPFLLRSLYTRQRPGMKKP